MYVIRGLYRLPVAIYRSAAPISVALNRWLFESRLDFLIYANALSGSNPFLDKQDKQKTRGVPRVFCLLVRAQGFEPWTP